MIEKGTTWVKHTGRFAVDGYFRMKEQGTAFTGLTPPADHLHIYPKDNAGITELFYRNSAGTERDLSGGLTGSGTANRLAYWSAAQVLAAVGALTQHRLLVADANGLPINGNALIAGSILFGGTNGIPEDDNTNLFWNDTQKTLLIGSATAKSTSSTLETVSTSTGDPRGVTLQQFSADIGAAQINLVKGRGSFATPGAVVSGDSLGVMFFRGYGSATVLHIGARIQALAAENYTTGAAGTILAFHTTPSAGILVAEKMRLLGDGDLVLGHTSAPFAGLAGRGLSVVRTGIIAENCTYTFGIVGTSSQNRLVTARGTAAAPTATQSGDTVVWSFVGFGATAFTAGRARIEAAATQNYTDAAQGAQLAFLTTPDGSTTTAIRLTIEKTGDVSHAPDVRHRMLSQNRFRHLNSIAVVSHTTAQTGLTVNTWNTATFATEDTDTDTVHISTSNTRLTAQIAGKYLVGGSLHIDETNIGTRTNAGVRMIKNGGTTTIYGNNTSETSATFSDPTLSVSVLIELAAADYMELQGLGTGASGTFDFPAVAGLSRFWMVYLGE